MTTKAKAPAQPAQVRFQVRISFEGMVVGDQFTMDPTDPYVKGLLGAGLIEEASPAAVLDASPLQAVDASGESQVTGDVSSPNAGVDARHVTPAPDDTSSPPVDATP